jgi:hypothetical protein
MRDMERRTRRVYEYVMLGIAEWARVPETFDHEDEGRGHEEAIVEEERGRLIGAVEVCRMSGRL